MNIEELEKQMSGISKLLYSVPTDIIEREVYVHERLTELKAITNYKNMYRLYKIIKKASSSYMQPQSFITNFMLNSIKYSCINGHRLSISCNSARYCLSNFYEYKECKTLGYMLPDVEIAKFIKDAKKGVDK